jgi:hypothetical protein
MRALEPARSHMGCLQISGRHEHVRGVAALHHSQVTEDVGETAPACTDSLPPMRESSMRTRHFANEGHGAVAEMAQGLKGDGARSVTRTTVVPDIFAQLFSVADPGSATCWLGCAMHVAGSKRVDEGDVP